MKTLLHFIAVIPAVISVAMPCRSFAEVRYQIDPLSLTRDSLRKYDLRGATQRIANGGRLGQFLEIKDPSQTGVRTVQEGDLKADSESHLQESATLFSGLPKQGSATLQDAPVKQPQPVAILHSPKDFRACVQKIYDPLSEQVHAKDLGNSASNTLETLLARASRAAGMPCAEHLGLGRFDAVPAQHLLRYFWIIQKDGDSTEQWSELFFLSFGQESPLESRASFRKLWSALSARWILSGQSWDWNQTEWTQLISEFPIDAASLQKALNQGHAAFARLRGIQ